MYYNKILRIWVLDPVDYLLLSAFLESLAVNQLKNYLSETEAMQRLKSSVIKKSRLIIKSDRPIFNSN